MEIISKEYVLKELEKYKVPGMGIGVVKDGQVLLADGFGYADLAKKTPIDQNTLWGIASCSKSFTSCLLVMLSEEGYFDMEEPIRDFLPDFRLYDPIASKLCTVKDILCHRTGIGGYDALWTDTCSRADLWERLRWLKPNKPFRGAVQYSNLMYTIAGHIAEKLTGKTYEELIREKIFLPLGMTRSNCSITEMCKDENHASPYWQGPVDGTSDAYLAGSDRPLLVENWNVDLGCPCGGINSCVSDMLKWLSFHLNDGVAGGKRLLSHEAMTLLHTAQVPYEMWEWQFPEFPPIGGYGLGWYNDVYRGHPVYWHIGEIEGYGTMQFLLPRDNLGIVVFNNIHKPDVLIECSCVYTIIDNVLGLPKEDWSSRFWAERNTYGHMLEDWQCDLMGEGAPVPGTSPSHDLDAYTGTYFESGHGEIEIFREGEKLRMRYRGMIQEVEHYHYDVFRVPHVKQDTLVYTCPLTFHTSYEDGSIDGFEFKLYSQVEPIWFCRKVGTENSLKLC